jgi:hypothetical protein
LIIEGCDKGGKSTLANAIAKRFGGKVCHFGKPKKHPATEYAEYAIVNNGNLILDRFYLGELVYGPLLRGKAGIDDVEFATIERILRKKQAILIQTTTSTALANKRLLVSKQDEAVDTRQNILAAKGFVEAGKRSNIQHHLTYDGSNYDNLNKILGKLEVLKDTVESDQAEVHKVCTGIGTAVGKKIVLVGESVNQKVTWLNLPFDKGFSSQFLLDSLKAAGIDERLVYVCNADRITAAELEFLARGKALFISLGKKADARLSHFDIPHAALPHPQYVKRFQWKNKGQYAKDLRAIVKGF